MTRKTDIWMPLYIGDYLSDTQHLTRDEHGGYLLLLMAYWRNGAPLQDDDKRLAAICRASRDEWAELRPVLAEFFSIEDGLWKHKRVDQEIDAAASKAERNSARGKAGAASRWQKDASEMLEQCLSNAKALPEQCESDGKSQSQSHSESHIQKQVERAANAPISLGTWIDRTRAQGKELIPLSDPIFDYCDKAGIPQEFVDLAWAEFKRKFSDGSKRQKDWRKTFRNYVEGNYLKLWWHDGQSYRLSTVGLQAKKVNEVAA